MEKKRILMHMCCGPCSVFPLSQLKKEWDVTGFFYNPNIHPYTEYQKRLETAEAFALSEEIRFIKIDEYDLESFLRNASFRESQRCIYCYASRLDRAASVARKGGYDAFTTSLLVSPFQKHELIRKLGEEAGVKHGIHFHYEDFRPGYKEGTALSKELGMYRQQYCGCIYSEKERYLPAKKTGKIE